MGSFSLMHWLIVAIVVLVLFGRGRISEVMGDFGKGIQSFRKGLADEGNDEAPAVTQDVDPERSSGVEAGYPARKPE